MATSPLVESIKRNIAQVKGYIASERDKLKRLTPGPQNKSARESIKRQIDSYKRSLEQLQKQLAAARGK